MQALEPVKTGGRKDEKLLPRWGPTSPLRIQVWTDVPPR